MPEAMSRPLSALSDLLHHLRPVLRPHEYVFCSVAPADEARALRSPPLATFREPEGLSVILSRDAADALGLCYDSVHRCITLQVQSSLMAVGLTAEVSSALARAGLSANVVAAHHHDHVFIPSAAADEAMTVLLALSADVRR